MKAKKISKFDGTEPVDPEFDVDVTRMKRVPAEKRHDAAPGDTDLRNCKVRITMYVDADVLQYFKDQAEKPYAPGYQTQINSALRQFIEQKSTSQDYERLLEDERFIQAVAERVRAKAR